MPLYTRLGDSGKTQMYGGEMISKSEPRIHAYGSIDELDAFLGLIRADESCSGELDRTLHSVQQALYIVKSDLATPLDYQGKARRATQEMVEEIERLIDDAEAKNSALTSFILPGGTRNGAMLHVARTVCRRAERWMVMLSEEREINYAALRYVNRLGDALFALARVVNGESGCEEEKAGE